MDNDEILEDLKKAVWENRRKVHGHYPDDGPWEKQAQMVRDWVEADVLAVLSRLDQLGLIVVSREGLDDFVAETVSNIEGICSEVGSVKRRAAEHGYALRVEGTGEKILGLDTIKGPITGRIDCGEQPASADTPRTK